MSTDCYILTPWVHLTTKTRHALVLPTRTYIRLRVMNRQISEQNRRFFSNKSVPKGLRKINKS